MDLVEENHVICQSNKPMIMLHDHNTDDYDDSVLFSVLCTLFRA